MSGAVAVPLRIAIDRRSQTRGLSTSNGTLRVADGKATTKVTFDKRAYVLRACGVDASIHTPHDVKVSVTAGSSQ